MNAAKYMRNAYIFRRIFGDWILSASTKSMAKYSVFDQITIRGVSIKDILA